MEGDKTADNEKELTSTSSSDMGKLLSTNKEEKSDSNDTLPTSSTDASTSIKSNRLVSDDPISSTSSEMDTTKFKTVEKTSTDDSDKPATFESEVESLDMSMAAQPTEKIEENVDDLVSDLETLLGESTGPFSIPYKSPEENEKTEVTSAIDELSNLLEDKPENEVSGNTGSSPDENANSDEPGTPAVLENVDNTDEQCEQNEENAKVEEAAKNGDGEDLKSTDGSMMQDCTEKAPELDAENSVGDLTTDANNSQNIKEALNDLPEEICKGEKDKTKDYSDLTAETEEHVDDSSLKIWEVEKHVGDDDLESSETSTVLECAEKTQEIVTGVPIENLASESKGSVDDNSQKVEEVVDDFSKCEGEKTEKNEEIIREHSTENTESKQIQETLGETTQSKTFSGDTAEENTDGKFEKDRKSEESSIKDVTTISENKVVEEICHPLADESFKEAQDIVESEHIEDIRAPSEELSVVQTETKEDHCQENPKIETTKTLEENTCPEECKANVEHVKDENNINSSLLEEQSSVQHVTQKHLEDQTISPVIGDQSNKLVQDRQEVECLGEETKSQDMDLLQDEGKVTEEANESNKCASKDDSNATIEEKTEIVVVSKEKESSKIDEQQDKQVVAYVQEDEKMEVEESESPYQLSKPSECSEDQKESEIEEQESLKHVAEESFMSRDNNQTESKIKQNIEFIAGAAILEQEDDSKETTVVEIMEQCITINMKVDSSEKLTKGHPEEVPNDVDEQSCTSDQKGELQLDSKGTSILEEQSTSTKENEESAADSQEFAADSQDFKQHIGISSKTEITRDNIENLSIEGEQVETINDLPENKDNCEKEQDAEEEKSIEEPIKTNLQESTREISSETPHAPNIIQDFQSVEETDRKRQGTPQNLPEGIAISERSVVSTPLDESEVTKVEPVVEEPEENAQCSREAVDEQPQDTKIMEISEEDNLPFTIEEQAQKFESDAIIHSKDIEEAETSLENLAEEPDKTVQSINESVNEKSQENVADEPEKTPQSLNRSVDEQLQQNVAVESINESVNEQSQEKAIILSEESNQEDIFKNKEQTEVESIDEQLQQNVAEEPEKTAESVNESVDEQSQENIILSEESNREDIFINKEQPEVESVGEQLQKNVAEEPENVAESIKESVDAESQENVIILSEESNQGDITKNKEQPEVESNTLMGSKNIKEDVVESVEQQFQNNKVVSVIEETEEDRAVVDQSTSEVKEENLSIESKEIEEKIIVSGTSTEQDDGDKEINTSIQRDKSYEKTEEDIKASDLQIIELNEVLQEDKSIEPVESVEEQEVVDKNDKIIRVRALDLGNKLDAEKEEAIDEAFNKEKEETMVEDKSEPLHGETTNKTTESSQFSKPQVAASKVALQEENAEELAESMQEEYSDETDKETVDLENQIEATLNKKSEITIIQNSSKVKTIEEQPNKDKKTLESLITGDLSENADKQKKIVHKLSDRDSLSGAKNTDNNEIKRNKRKLENIAEKIQELKSIPEINIRRKTVEQDLEKVVCLSEESSDSDTNDDVIKSLPIPADDTKDANYELDAVIHDVPLAEDLPPNQEETDLIEIAREVEQLQNVETIEPIVSEMPSEESMPGIEDILSDEPQEIPSEMPVDTEENLETILAVASLQNEPVHEVKVDRRLSEKELRDMEAIRMAVASITDSSQDTYDSYLVESTLTMENSIQEISSDVQELSSDVQELSSDTQEVLSDVQELPSDPQSVAEPIVEDTTVLSSSIAQIVHQDVVEKEVKNQTEESCNKDMDYVDIPDSSSEAKKNALIQTDVNINVKGVESVDQLTSNNEDSVQIQNPASPDTSKVLENVDVETTENSKKPTEVLDVKKIESSKEPTEVTDCNEPSIALLPESTIKENASSIPDQVKENEVSMPEVIEANKAVIAEKIVKKNKVSVSKQSGNKNKVSKEIVKDNVVSPEEVIEEKELSRSKHVVEEKEVVATEPVLEEKKKLPASEPIVKEKKVTSSELVIEDKKATVSKVVVEEKKITASEVVVEEKKATASEPVVEEKKILAPKRDVEKKGILANQQVVEENEILAPQQVIEERPLRNRTRRGNKVSEPLSISVEEIEKKDKPYSPKITIKPVKVPDEEVSTTSDAEGNKASLKITITKQSDKMHSILKVYNPDDDSEPAANQEEPIPKLIIKPKMQPVDPQHSPKMSTRSSKVYSPTSTQRCSSPRVTIKPVMKPAESKTEAISPLKITFKPVVKPDEGGKRHSPKTSKEQDQKNHNPKITIKPIPKPTEAEKEETLVSTPKVTIKPIKRHLEDNEADEQERSSPKITIKPVVKPTEQDTDHTNQTMPKLKIKPIKKLEDEENSVIEKDRDSPKISIKPVVKPVEIEEGEEEVKERIVLKINKGNLPTPSKESRKREYPEDDKTEKIGKLKLKFSTTGGQTHIVQEVEEGSKRQRKDSGYLGNPGKKDSEEVSNKRASEEKLPERSKRLRGSVTPDKANEDSQEEIKMLELSMDSPIVISEDSRSQHSADCVIVEDSQSGSPDISKIADIASRTTHIEASPVVTVGVVTPSSPAPKKRGRPRKVPLEVREELKDPPTTPQITPQTTPQSTPVVSAPSTPTEKSEPVTPIATPSPGGRPKRSCRGQNVIATLGIKPRKPRGGGRGRGSKVNMGDREPVAQAPVEPVQAVTMKPEKVKNKGKKKKKKSRSRSKSS